MSEFKDKINKQIKKIDKSISNEDEKLKVMKSIEEIISIFTSYVVFINERQAEIEERIDEVYDILTNIEDGMFDLEDSFSDAICPYCGENIPIYTKSNEEEFECPNCHHTIEFENHSNTIKINKIKNEEKKPRYNPDSIIDKLSSEYDPFSDYDSEDNLNDDSDLNYGDDDDIPF